MYCFRCAFSPKNEFEPRMSCVILSMEQVGFDFKGATRTSFSRIKMRSIDGRDSLQFLYRKSTKFAKVF